MKPRDVVTPNPVMTPKEVAEYLHLHLATLYKLIKRAKYQVSRSAATTVSCEMKSRNGSLKNSDRRCEDDIFVDAFLS